ncbi:hypothetical protein [Allobranchiibius huperziae]|uniref:Putative membrane protein n=1 Tax=Allobranchiibius huperziae TaxID=1874116 RepID=A0A853DNB6_9MICO|nr:hypothetical protein [Allobranchiibius huperziae]NYJ76484.1 putative membrane protein [Allobranchiibius huperziae]
MTLTRPKIAGIAAALTGISFAAGWGVRSLVGGFDLRTVAVVISAFASLMSVIVAVSITVHNDRRREAEVKTADQVRARELEQQATTREREADREAARRSEEASIAEHRAAVLRARRVTMIRPHTGLFSNADDQRLRVVVANFREDIIINIVLNLAVRGYFGGGEPFDGQVPGMFHLKSSIAHALSAEAKLEGVTLVNAPPSVGDAVQAGALAPGSVAMFEFEFESDRIRLDAQPVPVLTYTDLEDTTWECVYGLAPRVYSEFYPEDPPNTYPWWRSGPRRGTFEQI